MMKTLATFILIISGILTLFGQEPDNYYIKPDTGIIPQSTFKNYTQNNLNQKGTNSNTKLKIGFQAGASVSTFGKGTYFNSWVAPEVRYQVNSKFNLKVGTIAMYGNAYNLQNYIYQENSISNSERMAQYYVYAQGEYKVSDRIRLRGGTMREMSNISVNSNPFSLNHFGIDFKINDKASISADIQFANGRLPSSAYMSNNPYNNPFGSSYGFNCAASPFGGYFSNGW